MNESISGITSIIITVFLIALLFIVSGISYTLNDTTSLKQNVNYQMETYGGLNEKSCSIILGMKPFDDVFNVIEVDDEGNELRDCRNINGYQGKTRYGEETEYLMRIKVGVGVGGDGIVGDFTKKMQLKFDIPGIAVSKIRGDR